MSIASAIVVPSRPCRLPAAVQARRGDAGADRAPVRGCSVTRRAVVDVHLPATRQVRAVGHGWYLRPLAEGRRVLNDRGDLVLGECRRLLVAWKSQASERHAPGAHVEVEPGGTGVSERRNHGVSLRASLSSVAVT